jgi:pSer/pThr/pTyr-binding forkhead associated (FHA) protein
METVAKSLCINPGSAVVTLPAAEMSASTSAPAASLILQTTPDGEECGQRIPLDNPPIIIGRSPERCRVVLPWNSVSRQHAKIDVVHGQYVITDLGSRDGTYVNNRPIPSHCFIALNDGDYIKILDYLFRFRDESTGINTRNGIRTDNSKIA